MKLPKMKIYQWKGPAQKTVKRKMEEEAIYIELVPTMCQTCKGLYRLHTAQRNHIQSVDTTDL